MVREILILKRMALSPPRRHKLGQICKKNNNIIFKNLLINSRPFEVNSDCMVMMSMKPAIKILKFMAPGSGFRLQSRPIWPLSKKKYLLLHSHKYSLITKSIVILFKKSSTKIVKFYEPWDRGLGHVPVELYCEDVINLRKSSSIPHMLEITECMVLMSTNPSSSIVKFMARGSGVQAFGWGQ